jgi:hypothetical protein
MEEVPFVKAFTFFENWYQLAESQTDDAKRLAFYDAVMRYAFDGEEPENVGRNGDGAKRAAYFAFLTVQPVLEISRKRSAATDSIRKNQEEKSNGKSNGKSTEKSNGKSNGKSTEKSKSDLIKINDVHPLENKRKEEKRIEEKSSPARTRERPTQKQFLDGCLLAGIPANFAAPLYDEIVTNGWQDRDGRDIGNWRMYAKRIYNDHRLRPPSDAAQVSGDVAPAHISLEDL